MPIKHAALKQLRKDRKRAQHNQAIYSELKTLKKQFLTLRTQQKHEEATRLLPLIMRRFDQAAAKKLIHQNTASRTTSRLMRQLTHPQPQTTPSRSRVSASVRPAQAGPALSPSQKGGAGTTPPPPAPRPPAEAGPAPA